jgi:hypothetical protein
LIAKRDLHASTAALAGGVLIAACGWILERQRTTEGKLLPALIHVVDGCAIATVAKL